MSHSNLIDFQFQFENHLDLISNSLFITFGRYTKYLFAKRKIKTQMERKHDVNTKSKRNFWSACEIIRNDFLQFENELLSVGWHIKHAPEILLFQRIFEPNVNKAKKTETVNRCSQVRMSFKVVFTHDSFGGKKITHRIYLVCNTTTISSVMLSLKFTIGFFFVCCSYVLFFQLGLWWFCRKKFKITYLHNRHQFFFSIYVWNFHLQYT